MLNKEERELLIKTYEKTHDARLTAEIFSVHRSRVYAIVKQYKETGSVEVRTSQCGRKRKLTPEDDEKIKKLIDENNDITIREINERLGFEVNDETVRLHVVKLGYRYKKKSVYAAERDRSRCRSKKK
jgi:transposase